MEVNPIQPQGQTKVPPPPTPEVSVRTMQSDIRSIEQGEVTPTPEIVAPKPAFDSRAQNFIPDVAGPMVTEEEAMAPKSHRLLWAIIAVVIVVALAAVGYFVVYPMMQSPVVEPVNTPAQPAPEMPAQPTAAAHTSVFGNSVLAIPQATVTLGAVTREAIVQSLTDQGALVPSGLTEIVFQDTAGGQVSFATFFTALLPDFLDGQAIGSYVEDDFTTYIYKDQNGVWPGYVLTLKPEGTATLNQWLMNFEKAALGALFVTDPGAMAEFKDGTVKGIADRFATGASAGASLSYAVTATHLHISTSFEGLKAALSALGY